MTGFAALSAPVEEVVQAPGAITVEVVTGLPDFNALRADWDALFKRAAAPHNVFQSHLFLRHWTRHYLDDRTQIAIITGKVDGRLAMAWPLLRNRRLGVDILSFMGAPTAQFFDLLVEAGPYRPALLAAGWAEVVKLGADLFLARRLRADSSLSEVDGTGWLELPGRTSAPFARLCLRVRDNEPGPAYPAKDRSNYRRRLRRLAEEGDISFGSIPAGPKAVAAVAKAIGFKKHALREKAIWSPTVEDPKFQAFFESIAVDTETSLRISTIDCDNDHIGIDLSFDCHGHTFGHVLATDPDFSRDGVGGLVVHTTFAAAAGRGNQIFDLMAPADPYKMHHADGEVPVVDKAFAFPAAAS